MRTFRTIFFAALALGGLAALAACDHTLGGKQLADYCSDSRNATKDLCAVNTEIQSTRAQLAVTDRTANDALNTAKEADAKQVVCQTVKMRRARSASCAAGYTLMGCTQTHYSKRAGHMSIIRSIDDRQCTFAARVLEVQARCCMVGAPQMAEAPAPAPAAPAKPNS